MRLYRFIGMLTLGMSIDAASASADFSIDAASPDVPAVGEGDVLAPGPPAGPPPLVTTPASTYGLVAGEELDGLSDGTDTICPAGSAGCFTIITYSVDRAAAGAAAPITAQVGGNGAAGDVFQFKVTGTGVVLTPPALLTDATANDLTPLPPSQSNLDALAMSGGFMPPFYFSIDAAAVPGASARWGYAGLTAADILLAPGPTPAVFATAAALGLLASDDVDGIAIMDAAPGGVFSAADVVYVSLAPGSPSLAAIPAAPGDIIQVSPGPPVVIYPAALMGLAGADNLDAVSMLDPPVASVPALGPRGIVLLLLALSGVVAFRIRRVAARG